MPFRTGTDWEQSSGPLIDRKVHMEANDTTALVWPEGAPHDTLADGDHPILAIGRKANRPKNITGVVVSFHSATDIAVFNVADKFISRQLVANVTGYDGNGDPNAWQNTVYPGDPVYVDDSASIAALHTGCTLTFSDNNSAGAPNPVAGYVWWCQDEYADSYVGGENTTQQIDQPAEEGTSEVLTLCIEQVNDYGDIVAV